MKALLRDPRVDAAIDEATLARYTSGTYYEEGSETLFATYPASSGCHRYGSGRVRENL